MGNVGTRVTAALAALAAAGAMGAGTASAANGSPEGAGARAAAGNGRSFTPSVSRDGRYVAFASDATNLVRADTNGKRDIFVRDTMTGTTRRVSAASGGAQANGPSSNPVISRDGRYVAFLSEATNLVPGDTNRQQDAFRVDTRTGAVVRLSVGARGAQGNGRAANLDMDETGTRYVFSSTAPNLVAGDTNRIEDVFLRDLRSGSTTRVSKRTNGAQLTTGSVETTTISPNAAYIGFVYSGRGPQSGGYEWTRATGSVWWIEDDAEYFQNLSASNFGVGFLAGAYAEGSHCDAQYASTASASGGLDVWLGECAYYPADAFDSNPGGTMMALALDDDETGPTLHLLDTSLNLYAEKPGDHAVASLTRRTITPALAGDGQSVVFADTTGQIRKWVHKTGVVTLVSSN